MKIAIIRITDEVLANWDDVELLAAGEIGEIAVQGEQVTCAYYNREQARALAKIHTNDGGLYHRMGLGYLDEQGRLWFCGRKSERVITTGRTYFTVCCEGVFNVHPQVKRSALVSLTMNHKVQPGLCVELEADCRMDQQVLKNELLALGHNYQHTSAIREIFFHPAFPVDIRHNAKIGRARLAQWAQKQLP